MLKKIFLLLSAFIVLIPVFLILGWFRMGGHPMVGIEYQESPKGIVFDTSKNHPFSRQTLYALFDHQIMHGLGVKAEDVVNIDILKECGKKTSRIFYSEKVRDMEPGNKFRVRAGSFSVENGCSVKILFSLKKNNKPVWVEGIFRTSKNELFGIDLSDSFFWKGVFSIPGFFLWFWPVGILVYFAYVVIVMFFMSKLYKEIK